MMKKVIFLVVAVFMLLGTTACVNVVVKENPIPEKELTINPAEYNLARDLITAFVANDAKKFVALLPEETATHFNEQEFAVTRASVVKSVGEPIEFSYLTSLELTSFTPQIWKIRCKRSDLKNEKDFTSEVLFRVVTGMTKKNEAVIISFQFL